jgi:hypothetical protein
LDWLVQENNSEAIVLILISSIFCACTESGVSRRVADECSIPKFVSYRGILVCELRLVPSVPRVTVVGQISVAFSKPCALPGLARQRKGSRRKIYFISRIKRIALERPFCKIFYFLIFRNCAFLFVSRLGKRGVSRSSRHAGWDAVDATCRSVCLCADERHGADDEIVWS